MEAYLELCLFAMLNLKEVRWDLPFAAIESSNIIAVFILLLTLCIPVLLIVFYYKNKHRWDDETFNEKAGTFFEGVRSDEEYQNVLLANQILFFVRRFMLCFTLVFWH